MGQKTRSHWAWGWQNQFPDRQSREGLALYASHLLGLEDLPILEPKSIDEIELTPSCFAFPEHLNIEASSEKWDRITHCYGKSYPDQLRGFYGDYQNPPDWVAYPRNADEIQRLLAWASEAEVAVIPFGGGTSVVGGVEGQVGSAFKGVISLDLKYLDQLLEVDTASLSARIEAGIKGPALEKALAKHGLTLRHYPQSFEFSTLGGWIATRAGGHFATLYTHIDDLVQSIQTVTPAGRFESRRLPGSGAGPCPDRLIMGSEGIFGVITDAWMRVRKRPQFRAGASYHFQSFNAAVEAARRLSQSGLYPANCRLLDETEARLNGVTDDNTHVLLVAFEGAEFSLQPWMEKADAICLELGATCPKGITYRDNSAQKGEDAGASWKQAFIGAPYIQPTMISMGVIADTFETATTWDQFPALDRGIRAAVNRALEEECGGGHLSCRFTHVYPDGPAPYYTFIGKAKTGHEMEQWRAIKTAACDAIIEFGGTITHHHAVGRTHLPWYKKERPEGFGNVLKATKAVFDPAGILNPGVLIDGKSTDQ